MPRSRYLERGAAELGREARKRLAWFDYHDFHGRKVALTCRHFGISRQAFYRWKPCYDPHDLSTLEEGSHRPHHRRQPTWAVEQSERVRRLREQYPRWGKDKLAVLLRREGWPVSVSMVGRILTSLRQRGVFCVRTQRSARSHAGRSRGTPGGRIVALLHPRRCIMTNLKSMTVAVLLVGGVLALSAVATPQGEFATTSLPHVVRVGAPPQAKDVQGDTITVEKVRGTSSTLRPGSTYEVSGTYKLVSRDEALLAVWVTGVSRNRPVIVRGRYAPTLLTNLNDLHRPLPDQQEIVSKGEGSFTLRFHLWGAGDPHVSFCPYEGGGSFLSTYFLESPHGGRYGWAWLRRALRTAHHFLTSLPR